MLRLLSIPGYCADLDGSGVRADNRLAGQILGRSTVRKAELLEDLVSDSTQESSNEQWAREISHDVLNIQAQVDGVVKTEDGAFLARLNSDLLAGGTISQANLLRVMNIMADVQLKLENDLRSNVALVQGKLEGIRPTSDDIRAQPTMEGRLGKIEQRLKVLKDKQLLPPDYDVPKAMAGLRAELARQGVTVPEQLHQVKGQCEITLPANRPDFVDFWKQHPGFRMLDEKDGIIRCQVDYTQEDILANQCLGETFVEMTQHVQGGDVDFEDNLSSSVCLGLNLITGQYTINFNGQPIS